MEMNEEVKSARMGGSAFDVRRKIPLAESARGRWQSAATRLLSIEPIHEASIDQHGLMRISYDASFIGVRDIESLLGELDIDLQSSFWWKIKSGWYSYVDENAQASACSTGGACCSRPPSVNSVNRKSGKDNQWHFPD